jgi:hypothetical protein
MPTVPSLSAESAFQKRSIAYAIEIGAVTPDGILLDRATGEQAARHILRALRAVPQFALLFVDASGVRISSFTALKTTFAIFTAVRSREFTTRDMLVGAGPDALGGLREPGQPVPGCIAPSTGAWGARLPSSIPQGLAAAGSSGRAGRCDGIRCGDRTRR